MPQAKQGSNDMVATAIQQAKELEFERGQIQNRIKANRDLLRLLDGNNMLSEDDGAWLDTFYPTRERGNAKSREEVTATREAKLAARAEIARARGEEVPEDDSE